MLDAQYDITAIGLPFIDLIAQVDDEFLDRFGLVKGQVRDIAPSYILAIRSELTNYTIYPGGSPPNTCAGIHALGGKAVFLGRVGDDINGRAFRQAFPPGTVIFPNQPYENGTKTSSGIVIVLVTPDGATTIVAAPSVGDYLTDADIFPDFIRASKILYLQCHFLLQDQTRDAVVKAIEIAKSAGREIAISLHGPRTNVERAGIFIRNYLPLVDILVGNRNEFDLLFRPFDLDRAQDAKQLMVMTDGAKGAWIVGRAEKMHIPPHLLKTRDNTVGAGDAFAAGFFYGYIHGLALQTCGELGAECANAILDVPGARPVGSWKEIATKYLKDAPAAIRSVIGHPSGVNDLP